MSRERSIYPKCRGVTYRPAAPGVKRCEMCKIPARKGERFCFMHRHTMIVQMVKAGYLDPVPPNEDLQAFDGDAGLFSSWGGAGLRAKALRPGQCGL